ncbi:flocculation protein FLO11 isoform X2 [Etheostoma cragini]|uniref:flocculation protein FLO11 isoform X2 n=1 Tax=Etheostoma cragini TaxID=417921 RepID=UPI00155DEDC2|nr:flocculation protein FLO11 isoform X2 [Etheostoma cragini]
MAMDTSFATLVCYLLVFSFAAAQTENNMSITSTATTAGLNLTHTTTMVTSSNATVRVTGNSNLTENTTPFTSTTRNNETVNKTEATTESTSHRQTSQSTTVTAPLTNSTTLTTTSPGTATFTAVTNLTIQTTMGHISTPDTTINTTANPSHTVNTTSDSMYRTTKGLGLNVSDFTLTVFFSVVLGVFALALVVFVFHRCKHKIQYLHQPLNNSDDTDAFLAEDDTLVISGGLYDGHAIYDNVPTTPADQSQFHLQFLH